MRKVVVIFFAFLAMASLTGCEAFARKFTRKPKEPQKEEPLIEPQNYPDIAVSQDALYQDYFLFWDSWADELSSCLNTDSNFKKQKECAQEALDNLAKMQSLLNEEKAKQLNTFILDFTNVRDILREGNLTSADLFSLRQKVERIQLGVRRSFTFSKINKDLK